jgi:hypothetical protein
MVGRVARAFIPVDIGQLGVEGALIVAVAAGWACYGRSSHEASRTANRELLRLVRQIEDNFWTTGRKTFHRVGNKWDSYEQLLKFPQWT